MNGRLTEVVSISTSGAAMNAIPSSGILHLRARLVSEHRTKTNQTMKATYTMWLSAVALSASTVLATAQDQNRERPAGGRGMSPIIAALDADKDGEISAAEIANAAVALKTLDKNSDGKLTGEEFRPARGERGPGGDRGPRGDRPEAGGDAAAEKK